jgi:hypothetical protein
MKRNNPGCNCCGGFLVWDMGIPTFTLDMINFGHTLPELYGTNVEPFRPAGTGS